MKSKGNTVTSSSSTTPDAATAAAQQQIWQAAQAAGNGGPGTDAARGLYGNAVTGGNLGIAGLSGDPTAMASLMNPYQQQVIDRVKSNFGDLSKMTMNNVDDAASQAGAFGGSRHAIATGTALGDAQKGAQDQIASLLYSGYGDATSRASGLANLGMGAAGQYAGMDPNALRLAALRAGYIPGGSSTTASQTTPMQRNVGAGILGGATTGYETFHSPWGALAGGLLGAF